jgi:heterotetrameric sarcosine oxidase gamma subunit
VPEKVVVLERTGFGLATVMTRKGVDPARLGAALSISVPDGCACVKGDNLTLIGTGPGMWMALSEQTEPAWGDDLSRRLSDIASVSDQSGGYVIFRISGPLARTLLQRGAFIDFDPSVFRAGSVATTVIAHMGVIIWQADDSGVFDVALFRSFASSFQDWIDATASSISF